MEPLKLASAAVLGIALPIWVLALHPPLAAVLVALVLSAAANPICNAPIFGIITKRTPPALLPKVMTALLTAATIAGPIGLLAAGALLERAGLQWTFGIVAAGETLISLLFIAIVMRFRRTEAAVPGGPGRRCVASAASHGSRR